MKLFSLLGVVLLLAGGCSANRGPVGNVEGARSPLADPADNTLNSPTTGPSSAGLPGGPIGSPPDGSPVAPIAVGHR